MMNQLLLSTLSIPLYQQCIEPFRELLASTNIVTWWMLCSSFQLLPEASLR